MSLQTAIENVFKRLVAEQRYDKITVTMMCREAHISRSSFYACFETKEDIICSLFAQHALGATVQLNRTFAAHELRTMDRMITTKMYEDVYAQRDYYTALLRSIGPDSNVFVRCATRVIEEFNQQTILMDLDADEQWQKDYVAYYFASSQAMIMQKWIMNGMEPEPVKIARMYYHLTSTFWHDVMEKGLSLEQPE